MVVVSVESPWRSTSYASYSRSFVVYCLMKALILKLHSIGLKHIILDHHAQDFLMETAISNCFIYSVMKGEMYVQLNKYEFLN